MIEAATDNGRLVDPIHSPWLRCCAVLLAAAALFAIITGAAFTTNEYRPFYSFGQSHFMVAALVAVLTIGLVIWLLLTEKRVWMRRLAWIALAIAIVEGLLGFITVPQPPAVRFVHAFLAQLFFATTVAMAVFTSRGWTRIPELVRCRPSVRILAMMIAILVLAQAALGVAFRHGVIDVTLHVLGALVVAIFVVALALSVLYRSRHEPLRPFGVTLLIVTALQVFLGLGLFSMGSPDVDPSAVIVVTIVHAATAALTLAATVVMVVLVLCSVPASANR
jgi:cytochrome c oxidase assembly protein subunit 15